MVMNMILSMWVVSTNCYLPPKISFASSMPISWACSGVTSPQAESLNQVSAQVRSLVDGMAAGPGKFDIRRFGGATIGGKQAAFHPSFGLQI